MYLYPIWAILPQNVAKTMFKTYILVRINKLTHKSLKIIHKSSENALFSRVISLLERK